MEIDYSWLENSAKELRDLINRLSHTPTVLFVDDDENDLFLSKRLLDKFLVDVTYCNDPTKVEALVTEKTFDLVFVDVVMPHLTGFELIEKIKKIPTHNTHFIAVTGSDDARTLSQAIKSGVLLMLFTKPLNETKLSIFFKRKV